MDDGGEGETLTRAQVRLRDELEDDGIALPAQFSASHLLQELDYARRPRVHERRIPLYGSVLLPSGATLSPHGDLVDLIALELPLADCRRFADGRASYLVRRQNEQPLLACFRRTVQLEADLIDIQAATGVAIVQRTVLGVARVITPAGVIEWTGSAWSMRPSSRSYRSPLESAVPEGPSELLAGLLDFCIHWLSPGRVGATLVLALKADSHSAALLDVDSSLRPPPLSVAHRHHYPALLAALQQIDLAALIAPDGTVKRLGVGLRSTAASDAAVAQIGGMRHRSAARYTWDHRDTVAFVVSDDGPVTVFRHGVPITLACTRPSMVGEL